MRARACLYFGVFILGALVLAPMLDLVALACAPGSPLALMLPPGVQLMTAGPGLELVTGFATAPGAVPIAMTMAAGNSLQIRNCDLAKRVSMLEMWGDWQTAGYLGYRSPKMHDVIRGIRVFGTASDVAPLLPLGRDQRLYPQDILIGEISGSAVAGDIETGCMLLYYEDLPGTNARFITYDTLMKRGVNIEPVENTLALGVAGGYSGQEAINIEQDFFKANTDYALCGYVVSVECAAVRWQGIDTGNLGVGGPGNETLRHVTSNWFIRLSQAFGIPLIPVFNSANKQGILIDGVQDENGADTLVNSMFVELAPA